MLGILISFLQCTQRHQWVWQERSVPKPYRLIHLEVTHALRGGRREGITPQEHIVSCGVLCVFAAPFEGWAGWALNEHHPAGPGNAGWAWRAYIPILGQGLAWPGSVYTYTRRPPNERPTWDHRSARAPGRARPGPAALRSPSIAPPGPGRG